MSTKRISTLLETWKLTHEPQKLAPYHIPIYVNSTTQKSFPQQGPTSATKFIHNLQILMCRQLKLYTRDKPLIITGLISTCIFLTLYGTLWYQLPVSETGIQSRLGFFFMFSLNRFFSSIFGVVLKLPLKFDLFKRERESGMYSGMEGYWSMVSSVQRFWPLLY